MKTLAQLKRDLKIGDTLILVNAPDMPNHKYLNIPRYIISKQTNCLVLAENKDDKKGSYLDLKTASLIEATETTLKIYDPGYRDLTDAEKDFRKNQPSNRPEYSEAVKRDIMTDGSSTYWHDKQYYAAFGIEYLQGHAEVKGKYYDCNRKQIRDNAIKGNLSLEYRLIIN